MPRTLEIRFAPDGAGLEAPPTPRARGADAAGGGWSLQPGTYARALSLERALASAEFTTVLGGSAGRNNNSSGDGGVTRLRRHQAHAREAFASAADGVFAYRATCDESSPSPGDARDDEAAAAVRPARPPSPGTGCVRARVALQASVRLARCHQKVLARLSARWYHMYSGRPA